MNDALTKIFKLPLMDNFHDYSGPYSNSRYYHLLKSHLVNAFLKRQSGADKTFLDAGAGRGPYSALASNLYGKVFLFEFDQTELDIAKENINKFIPDAKNIESAQVDLRKIPLNNESVDTIVCSEVVEHIPNQELAVNELYRVLKKDGKVLFSMPNAFSLFYFRVRNNKSHRNVLGKMHGVNFKSIDSPEKANLSHADWEMVRHVSFPYWKIELLVKKAGFKIISRRGANILPLPTPIRKFLMLNFPLFLDIWIKTDRFLGKMFPQFGSFYFLELKK